MSPFFKNLSENMSPHEIHAVSLWSCRPQLCLISYWCRLVLLCHCYQMMAPNATMLRIWLENKAVPFLLQSLWSRPPGCVNPLASAHWKGRKGWGHGCNQWEHLRFSDEPVLYCARGCLRAQLASLALSQRNKGELAQWWGKSNKSKATREHPWWRELVPFLAW